MVYDVKEVPKGFHIHANGGGLVQDTAVVEASVYVGGNARVSGDAQVYGNAWEISPCYFQGHKHAITLCAHNKIAIGCEIHTLDEWPELAEEIGERNGYTALDIEIYKLHIAHIAKVARLLWPKQEKTNQ